MKRKKYVHIYTEAEKSRFGIITMSITFYGGVNNDLYDVHITKEVDFNIHGMNYLTLLHSSIYEKNLMAFVVNQFNQYNLDEVRMDDIVEEIFQLKDL